MAKFKTKYGVSHLDQRGMNEGSHNKREEQPLKRTKAATGTREENKQTKKDIYPGGSAGKESACNARDLGLIPGLGRPPGEGKDYPLQCYGLENSMDSPWDHKE